jgi:hypothetical protein
VTRKLDEFAENLHRLDDFDCRVIPRHYQEAVLIYTYGMRKKVDLGGRMLSPETIRQFTEFNRTFKETGYNKRLASQKLVRAFGQTYFYYYAFGISGITR